MTVRPLAVVINGREPAAARRSADVAAFDIAELPAEPFALGHCGLWVAASVGSASEAAAVLMAVARGVAVVVDLRLDGPAADQFLDDLSRIADVREDLDVDVDVALDPEHEELLDALVAGLTLTAAADRLGWSRRTATRRLRDARERLGATSTVEALQMHRRRRHDQR